MTKHYSFPINTPHGPATINIPLEEFRQCKCGSGLFDVRYRIAWVKPAGVIGAQPVCFKAEIYLCSACGNELTAEAKMNGTEKRWDAT